MEILEQTPDTKAGHMVAVEVQPAKRTIRIGQMCKIMCSEAFLGIEPGTIRVVDILPYEEVPNDDAEAFTDTYSDLSHIESEDIKQEYRMAFYTMTTQPWVSYCYPHSENLIWYMPLEEFVNHTIHY